MTLHATAQPLRGTDDPRWKQLAPAHQSVLAPLAKDWETLTADHRSKWLEVARRYAILNPEQQRRAREKMQEWARMSPEQRRVARLNFQEVRTLAPSTDRQAQWEAYQSLPQEQRQQLAERRPGPVRAAPSASPASSPSTALRTAPLTTVAPKSNVVASPAKSASPSALPGNGAVVRAGTGATTNLLNDKSTGKPSHQQGGLPKIAASPGMVDSATLLPKRGPQAAGALPVRGTPMAAPQVAPLPELAASRSETTTAAGS
ncbi:DUF3106 domain-containing protein [Ideonella livida]|uniref:DUF3106 domain-containing protein n=1 Tax=Ideonella livida TaxID=2707176 RepID=A0A7C9TJ22_9BURK|nr:DUF3106 domain-containing protein [Ideonella livida]NDY90744.1 DUF3106 domain-containing protein [Ideonella livida]